MFLRQFAWLRQIGAVLPLLIFVSFLGNLQAQEESGVLESTSEVLQSREFKGSGVTLPEAETLPAGLTPDSEIAKLPTIEALLGRLPETVCGTDTRVRQTVTTTFPQRTTCQLILTLPNGSKAIGTGFLIGRGTVATAGHCVHTGGTSGGWMRRIEVIPGRNGTATGSRPFGTFFSSNLRSVTGWTQSASSNSDYGAIILSTPIGNTTGWLGLAAYSSTTLSGLTINTLGYPGDKPTGTQWSTFGTISSVSSNRFFYQMDTAGGQSGSSVYRFTNGNRFTVGIHTNGGCPNSATRITTSVFNNLVTWKNAGGG